MQLVRDAGGLAQLPIHLSALEVANAWMGDFAAAASLLAEEESLAAAAGSRFAPYIALWLRALQGRDAEALAAIQNALEHASAGQGTAATAAHWATAVLYNGLARYEEAAGAARQAAADTLERLSRTPLRPELARAHLLYGEWLRRENRRADARDQLGAAYDQFTSIGMEGFGERARMELLATGGKAHGRAVETLDQLTAQEREIARLARDGMSNPEIGARLFLSPRTIEWHLSNVYAKLGIGSRRQLAGALATSEPGPLST